MKPNEAEMRMAYQIKATSQNASLNEIYKISVALHTIVSIPGYVHLYRSLLQFYDMPENEVKEMLYLLNTANLDCYEYYPPERALIENGPVAFYGWLEHKDCRPYRTEVQL